MNTEQVEMYRAVQKYKGEWRVFDPVLYWGEFGVIIAISPATSFLTVQHKKGHISGIHPDDPDLLWLPPTAPRLGEDDGRNLWDMVDWKKWYIHVNDNNLVAMYLKDIGGGIAFIEAPTLPEVLLVALQWEGNYDEVTK